MRIRAKTEKISEKPYEKRALFLDFDWKTLYNLMLIQRIESLLDSFFAKIRLFFNIVLILQIYC